MKFDIRNKKKAAFLLFVFLIFTAYYQIYKFNYSESSNTRLVEHARNHHTHNLQEGGIIP